MRFATLPPSLHNPVMWAELRHQRHVIRSNHAGRVWIILAVLLVVPGMIGSLIHFGAGLLVPFVPGVVDFFTSSTAGDVFWALEFTAHGALYFVVTLITLALSAESISREKDGLTWDSLLLTGMEPHQIVLGKWWASTRMLLGDHLMVAVLRLGIVAWIVIGLDALGLLPLGPWGLPPETVLLPILAVITFIYTALDMAFTAALGVLSALLSRGGLITSTIILAVRFVVMAGGLYLWVLTSILLVEYPGGVYLRLTAVGFVIYGLLIWLTLTLARTAVEQHARLG